MKLKVRCPSCAKLYEVESEEILNETPLFQCIACESRFSFEFDPQEISFDPQNIQTFLVQTPAEQAFAAKQQEIVREQVAAADGKACPKCGALNDRKSSECYSCHVIFERLDGLPQDVTLRAQPSLVRKWKNLLENFENEELHEEFIRSCHELDAHRFAIMKYEEIKTAQGGDALCDLMIARVNSLMMLGLENKPMKKGEAFSSARPKWFKYLFWGPYGLSALLALWGILSLGHRNLIGVGMALACAASGLIIMVRGKISWSDFVE